MEDPRPKIWASFFNEAGLSGQVSAKYARAFSDQLVQMRHFLEAVLDSSERGPYLKELGVVPGHNWQIMKQARKLVASQERAQLEMVLDIVKFDASDVTENNNEEESEEGDVDEEEVEEDGVGEEVDDYGATVPEANELPVPCSHNLGQNCLNCSHCDQHLNIKSLHRHCRLRHGLETTKVSRKRKSRSSSRTTVVKSSPRSSDSSPTGPVPPLPKVTKHSLRFFKSLGQTSNTDSEEDEPVNIVPPPAASIVSNTVTGNNISSLSADQSSSISSLSLLYPNPSISLVCCSADSGSDLPTAGLQPQVHDEVGSGDVISAYNLTSSIVSVPSSFPENSRKATLRSHSKEYSPKPNVNACVIRLHRVIIPALATNAPNNSTNTITSVPSHPIPTPTQEETSLDPIECAVESALSNVLKSLMLKSNQSSCAASESQNCDDPAVSKDPDSFRSVFKEGLTSLAIGSAEDRPVVRVVVTSIGESEGVIMNIRKRPGRKPKLMIGQ